MYSETSSGRRESDIAIGSRKQAVPLARPRDASWPPGRALEFYRPRLLQQLAAKSNQIHLPFLQQWLVFSGAESKPSRCIVVCYVRENWNRRCTIKVGGWTDEEKNPINKKEC